MRFFPPTVHRALAFALAFLVFAPGCSSKDEPRKPGPGADTQFYAAEVVPEAYAGIYGTWSYVGYQGGFGSNGPDFDELRVIPFGMIETYRDGMLVGTAKLVVGEPWDSKYPFDRSLEVGIEASWVTPEFAPAMLRREGEAAVSRLTLWSATNRLGIVEDVLRFDSDGMDFPADLFVRPHPATPEGDTRYYASEIVPSAYDGLYGTWLNDGYYGGVAEEGRTFDELRIVPFGVLEAYRADVLVGVAQLGVDEATPDFLRIEVIPDPGWGDWMLPAALGRWLYTPARLYLGTATHEGGEGDPLSGQLVDTLVIGPEEVNESSAHFYRAR
jgi:hypothetical protein